MLGSIGTAGGESTRLACFLAALLGFFPARFGGHGVEAERDDGAACGASVVLLDSVGGAGFEGAFFCHATETRADFASQLRVLFAPAAMGLEELRAVPTLEGRHPEEFAAPALALGAGKHPVIKPFPW